MPAGSPVSVATSHSPWDSPAVSNRSIDARVFYRSRPAGGAVCRGGYRAVVGLPKSAGKR